MNNFPINYMFTKKLEDSNDILISNELYYMIHRVFFENKKFIRFYNNNVSMFDNIKHYFHLVTPSPWPLISSLIAFFLMGGAVLYFHFFTKGGFLVFLGFILLLAVMFVWWSDVKSEATFEGFHTKKVQLGLRYGMFLFILSEVMFFFSFFWAFFHSSLAPAIEIGSMWPPFEINCFDYTKVPLLNTIILLYSGAAVTWAHYSLLSYNDKLELSPKLQNNLIFMSYLEYHMYIWYNGVSNKKETMKALCFTMGLALFFTFFQVYEYLEASFSFFDGVYGSTFYLATGFHGLHVIIGTIFLIVCLLRLINNHFSMLHHFGFEAAAWYWHFVDVVWLFLFVSIYIWGSIF